MLVTQSSLLCPVVNLPFGKYPKPKANSPFFPTLPGKASVLYNGYSYFTSPSHPLQLQLQNSMEPRPDDEGIGILDFFQGKNILLTGATGLLGKVFVEKMLRSTSVGKIYLLIKAKDKEAAFGRLTDEIVNSELFKCLREKHGKSYQGFVREKLIPIAGNICEPNLGMDSESAAAIREDVHLIIQSAASTTFDDRYDSLLDANMNAPQRLMRFAKTCKNLELFTHISTAYVNGKKKGTILEKPLIMGGHGGKEGDDSLFPQLDVAYEISMILKSSAALTDYDATKNLKKLGQERASVLGWYNAYHLTKAMGEMVLSEIRGDVPLLVVRPTVIESCYKEPFPGWIQGHRMSYPVIMSYGKGYLPAFFGNPDVVIDFIPVDMVVNTTIAAIAMEGNMHNPQHSVYHVGSSATNPLKFSQFFEHLYQYFNTTPLIESKRVSKIKFFSNFDDFSNYTRDQIFRDNGTYNGDDEKITRKFRYQCKARAMYAEQICKMYGFIGFFEARFETSNNQKLIEEMSKEEKRSFEVDARKIDWRKYFQEIHIPGIRKHIINGDI